MPIPLKYTAEFEESSYYHVFNRTNNKEPLFLSDDNRHFFLKKFQDIVGIYTDTLCWNLLLNHFHFFVKIKTIEEITRALKQIQQFKSMSEKRFLNNEITFNTLIQNSFRRFFQSYALAYNKQHGRSGNLFHRPFRRVIVTNSSYYTAVIVYIHTNAWKHGLCDDFRDYKWSSYQTLLDEASGNSEHQEVIKWFGGQEAFARDHLNSAPLYKNFIF